jgi:hypothetical protein
MAAERPTPPALALQLPHETTKGLYGGRVHHAAVAMREAASFSRYQNLQIDAQEVNDCGF